MTKRYYYDCPLQAAYMAKYFGMKFGLKCNGIVVWDCQRNGMSKEWHPITEWQHIAEDGASEDYQPLYIHPDSLSILEPQEDDVIIDDEDYPWLVSSCGYRNNCTIFEAQEWMKEIIKRDGKPFFWPLVEENINEE